MFWIINELVKSLHTERYSPNILGSSITASTSQESQTSCFPLRKLLIDWLLTRGDVQEIHPRHLTPTRTALLVHNLTLQKPNCVDIRSENLKTESSFVEQLFLKTSYGSLSDNSLKCAVPSDNNNSSDSKADSFSHFENPPVEAVVDHVIKSLKSVTSSLMECTETTVSNLRY